MKAKKLNDDNFLEAMDRSNKIVEQLQEVKQLKAERAHFIIATIHNVDIAQTPMVKIMATPMSGPISLFLIDNLESALADIRNNVAQDTTKERPPTIQAGILHGERRSPSSEGTPYGARAFGAACQFGGGGYPGGDIEHGSHDRGNYQDRGRNSTYNIANSPW